MPTKSKWNEIKNRHTGVDQWYGNIKWLEYRHDRLYAKLMNMPIVNQSAESRALIWVKRLQLIRIQTTQLIVEGFR